MSHHPDLSQAAADLGRGLRAAVRGGNTQRSPEPAWTDVVFDLPEDRAHRALVLVLRLLTDDPDSLARMVADAKQRRRG